MVIAMALMTGYTDRIQEKLLENGSLLISSTLPLGMDEEDLGSGDPHPRDLLELEGVESVARVTYAQGSIAAGRPESGLDVVLRGVVPGDGGRLGGDEEELGPDERGLRGVRLGADLADRLGAEIGDRLELVVVSLEDAGPRYRYRALRLSSTFKTGFAEFDGTYGVVHHEVLDDLGDLPVVYEVVADDELVDSVRDRAQADLGDWWLVTDWRGQNPGLFTALRLQKWALFLVLGLIVVVSTFNVAASLVVLVREKTRDIGVFSALGLRPRHLEILFVACGGMLGAVGTLLGVALGGAISWFLTRTRLIRFDADVAAIYFIDYVPFDVRITDVVAVASFSIAVTLLACWLPARRAARVDPAVALRYE